MPSASKASRLFERIDRQEYLFCQTLNRTLRFRPVLGYFRAVSRLGDGWFWYALILSLPVLAPATGTGLALLMTLTGLACTLIYRLLKQRLARNRPFISFPAIRCATPPLDRYSFPSGHTLHAACFQVMLAGPLPELARWVLPFTLSVAASRVILGLHYPSDVLAGALLGASLGLASVHWLMPLLPL